MEWLKLLYENIGAPYPRASLAIAACLGAAIFGGAWWLLGREYQKSKSQSISTDTVTRTDRPAKGTTRIKPPVKETLSKSRASLTVEPPSGGSTEELPAPIREDMDAYQVPIMREFVRDMGVDEMWLSQIFQRPHDGNPIGPVVDYPGAIRRLAEKSEIEILEIVEQPYQTLYAETFKVNIRFRIKRLSPREEPKRRRSGN